jgi:hypothetical protein
VLIGKADVPERLQGLDHAFGALGSSRRQPAADRPLVAGSQPPVIDVNPTELAGRKRLGDGRLAATTANLLKIWRYQI